VPNTVQKLPNEPIVLDKMSPDYSLSAELPAGISKLFEIADNLTEPVFWIVDISETKEITIEDILTGTELLIKGKKPFYRHCNIREVLYVSTSRLILMAAAGLASEIFGNLKIHIFADLESALQYARKQL
jgi:hypothetical protein